MLLARNLARIIDGHRIWSGISMIITEGDRIALRGPTGSGKTLLMRTLVGLDESDEGEIWYRNQNILEWNLPEYRRRVRYIPQDAAFISGTVRESIELFFSFKVNRFRESDKKLLSKYLNILELPESLLDKTAEYLSGGEKQVVALLRSLLLGPEILLLDEPTSNLDEAMVDRMEKLIASWIDEDPGRAYIWTSHDSRQLDRMTHASLTLTGSGLPDAVPKKP